MALLANDGTIVRRWPASPLPAIIDRTKLDRAKPRPDLVKPLKSAKRAHIESALILCGGDRSLAARQLGVSRGALQKWIAEFRAEDFEG